MRDSNLVPIPYRSWRPVLEEFGFLGLDQFKGRGFFDAIDVRVEEIQLGPRSRRDYFGKGVSTQFFDNGGRLDFYGLFFKDRSMLGSSALVRLFRDERKVVGVGDPLYNPIASWAFFNGLDFRANYGIKDWSGSGSGYCSDLGEIEGVLNGLLGFHKEVHDLYGR